MFGSGIHFQVFFLNIKNPNIQEGGMSLELCFSLTIIVESRIRYFHDEQCRRGIVG